MQLGVHFALTDAEVASFLAARGNDAQLANLIEQLEESGTATMCETDKAWDIISCALAPSGSERDPDDWPYTGVIVGAEELEDDSDEMMLGYTPASKVGEVAQALEDLDDELFGEAYEAMPEELRNPEYGDEEREYALAYVKALKVFFSEAARTGKHVLFHVN